MTAAVIQLPVQPRPISLNRTEIREAIMRGLFENITLAAEQYRAGVTPVSTLLEVIEHSRLYADAAEPSLG